MNMHMDVLMEPLHLCVAASDVCVPALLWLGSCHDSSLLMGMHLFPLCVLVDVTKRRRMYSMSDVHVLGQIFMCMLV